MRDVLCGGGNARAMAFDDVVGGVVADAVIEFGEYKR